MKLRCGRFAAVVRVALDRAHLKPEHPEGTSEPSRLNLRGLTREGAPAKPCRMAFRILAGVVFVLSLGCSEQSERAPDPGKESPTTPDSSVAEARPSGGNSSTGDDAHDSGKIRVRPEDQPRKPPIAEPVAGSPGRVISPFNGKEINVIGLPIGSLISDPHYPRSEKKYFRVPETPSVPEGKPVPGKPGYVFSPHTNKLIDIRKSNSDSVIPDPTTPEDDRRYLRTPSEPEDDSDRR